MPNAEPSTFTTLDNAHHAARIRQVNSLYQTSALVNIEYQVDGATSEFVERLSAFAKQGTTIDMSDWLKYFAFDAVGSLSVSSQCLTYVSEWHTDQFFLSLASLLVFFEKGQILLVSWTLYMRTHFMVLSPAYITSGTPRHTRYGNGSPRKNAAGA